MVVKKTGRTKIRPRHQRRESGETREMLRVLYDQRNSIFEDLRNTEVLEVYDNLQLQLFEVNGNIKDAKRIMKQELRQGI